MPNRDRYPAGVPCWVDTEQADPEAGRDFYGGLFGWHLEDVAPAQAPGHYFQATIDGGTVAAVGSAQNGSTAAAWTTYIAVEDADAAAARVREAGGAVVAEPMDVSDAGRVASFKDPEGVAFSVWQARRHIGAQVVNL